MRILSARRFTLPLVTTISLCGAAAAPAAAAVSVYPFPNSRYEMPQTQIAFRGVPAGQIGRVTVVGSKSGSHSGRVLADSDGNGGSFVADRPFTPRERVTVSTGLSLLGAPTGKFGFTIASPGQQIKAAPLPVIPAGRNGVQRFHSRPDLAPASITVNRNSAAVSGGDIFVAPQFGPAQDGPMILDPAGRLVWFHPIAMKAQQLATDFRAQQLYGKPVLTWWQGNTNNGSGRGVGVVFDQDYRLQQIVRAADGVQMDLHEFLVTPTGEAYFIAVQPVWLPGLHRPIADGIVQEVDMKTGLVLFNWNALDHIPLSTSTQYGPRASGHIMDPYHLNSVTLTTDGQLLVSARNTSAVYKIDRNSGALIWTLGGKGTSFRMGRGTVTAFQHDAVQQSDGTITIFDDGAGPPPVHSSSRAIRVAINPYTMTATLVREYGHAPRILADFEGGTQALPNGDVFIGWGQQPYFSEDDAAGRQVFDARFTVPTASYRAYRFPWSSQPVITPAISLDNGVDGTTTAYASWNGATGIAAWRLLSGDRPDALSVLGGGPPHGFETALAVHSGNPYYQLQALGAAGQMLASSRIATGAQHVAIYGRSAFVSSGGLGGMPVGCFATHACRVAATVSSGNRVLARSGAQTVAANGTGLLYFRLSGSGRAQLARARHLGVTLAVRDGVSHASASETVTLVAFSTSGGGPRRSASHHGSLSLLGGTDFVSARGVGGILASCAAATPCVAALTLTAGSTVIARTSAEREGPHQAGYFMFKLTAAGQSLLARAGGRQLAAQVSLSGPTGSAGGTVALVPFR